MAFGVWKITESKSYDAVFIGGGKFCCIIDFFGATSRVCLLCYVRCGMESVASSLAGDQGMCNMEIFC